MKIELNNVIAERGAKTLYKSGNYCVKVFDGSYSKADILNEALNHARVEETGLSVPKIEEVAKIDGRWAIVSEFINGKTLDVLAAENPERGAEYLDKFVSLQLLIQSYKCPLLNRIKDKMNRKISASGLDPTLRYELHHMIDGMPKHAKLCHGDFNPSNIIVGDDGKDYIIDWAHATQGNASADAARTYLIFCLNGRAELAEKYLDLFCKKSDTAKQYVQKWMPIVAASQLVKGKPEEKAFLLRWATVVDFE
ncbi:MAG: phosphotransferase [Clostridiales bacterium]|jgi:tRNA A-37 threonylcarbamoyl transferase component Bud32|nr:phosphotransferase [Clostridiales bacterium]